MARVVKRKSHNERKESDDDQTKISHVKNSQIISNLSVRGNAVIYMNSTNGKLHSLSK